MANMLASATNSAIRFNPEFFDQAAIDKLLNLRQPKISMMSPELRISPILNIPVFKEEPWDDQAFGEAFQEGTGICEEDTDVSGIINKRSEVLGQAYEDLKAQLQNPAISPDVAEHNKEVRDTLEIVTDPNGVVAFEVSGTRLLEVNPALQSGSTFEKIMQIAVVVFDVFSILCTIIGILLTTGPQWVKQIAEYIKGIGQPILDWAGQIPGKIGDLVSKLSGAGPTSPEWMVKLKDCASQVGALLVDLMKDGWKNPQFISAMRYCIKTLLTTNWYTICYYMLQLAATICLMITSSGLVVVAKIIAALIQLGIFIWDTIKLVGMFTVSIVDENKNCD
jgi:hypothetical protein